MYDGGTQYFVVYHCFIFLSRALQTRKRKGTLTCQVSAQLHSRVCTYVNNLLAVLCTCSIDSKVVLQ